MSRMIDADALYEKTAEWEVRALAVIEKLNRKPFEEMDANEITEWRKWSCILNERSAFKHDVADAPTVEQQQWIPVIKKLPEKSGFYLVTTISGYIKVAYFTKTDSDWLYWVVVAWMPLPMPFREGEESE